MSPFQYHQPKIKTRGAASGIISIPYCMIVVMVAFSMAQPLYRITGNASNYSDIYDEFLSVTSGSVASLYLNIRRHIFKICRHVCSVE
jgi:hypothetical protein